MMRGVALLLLLLPLACLHAQVRRDTLFLHFPSGSHDLEKAEARKLQAYVQRLDSFEVGGISLTGFCDDRGDSLSNQRLSLARAQHVRNQLAVMGVDTSLIKTLKGKGEVQLRGGASEDDERQANRRVQMITLLRPAAPSILPDTLEVGDRVTLQNIQFEGGTRLLMKESLPAYRQLQRALREQTKYEVCILGYVCCAARGADGEDLQTGEWNLSEMRAKTIYDALIKSGIDPTRLSYKGLGSQPTGRGPDADRRVEVLVTGVRK